MGQPLGSGVAMLAPADATADTPMMFGGGGNVRQDGTFTLTNVAPGSYTLTVASRPFGRRGGRGGDIEGEIASIPLAVVNEDVTGIHVVTTKGATLSGVVVAAQGSSAPLRRAASRSRRRPCPLDAAPGLERRASRTARSR